LVRQAIELWLARREGNAADCDRLASEIEASRPRLSGTCNDQPFDDFRDANDLTSFFFEVLTSTGKYYWVPFDTVETVEFHKPARPREVLWRRARMVVRGGPDGEVYIPSIYPGSHGSSDVAIQTGRGVDWEGAEGGFVQGFGQRLYLAGEADHTLLDLQQLAFAGA
jgi:type VI secretion system protein ImpE